MSGGGKDGGGSQTITQTVQVPEFLRPFVEQASSVGQDALSQIQSIARPGDSLVAGFDPTQLEALDLQEAVARGQGGFIPAAQDALQSTARGDFLFGGQGFDQAVDAAIRAVQPGVLSTFGRAGRGVSGLAQQAIAQSATDSFANLFNQERSRQLNAASALPNIGLLPANILSEVGAQRQGQTQRELQGPLALQQTALQSALGVTPAFSPLFGGQTTQPVSGGGSKAGDILGVGLSLAGLPTGGGSSVGGTLLSGLL